MKQWLKSIFYVPKHAKPADENIRRLLVPAFLGIFLCMVCLAGTTWTWFTADVQTQPQTIEAGNYNISVIVDGVPVSAPITLDAGKAYAVTLTAGGTAPSGGYCVVEGGEKRLYTRQIRPGETLDFTFTPEKTAVYTFIAMWGKYTGGGDLIGQEQPAHPAEPDEPSAEPPSEAGPTDEGAVYIVQPGDTLWDIAKTYGTTVAAIVACNDIKNPDFLLVGQKLILPAGREQSAPPSDGAPDSGTDTQSEPTNIK